MHIMQISVFLENKSGRLARVTDTLAKNNINIRALSIADTSDFGILRLIVNEPDKALKVLKEDGFTVSATEVVAVAVPDRPGGLAGMLKVFHENQINLEYLYAFMGNNTNKAITVCRVEKPEKAIAALNAAGILVISEEELYNL